MRQYAKVAGAQATIQLAKHLRRDGGNFICFSAPPALSVAQRMSNFNSDGSQENDWEDRGELAWNEFDWESYLREQDAVVRRYLNFYEAAKNDSERIDAVAEKMGWSHDDWSDDGDSDDDDDDDESDSATFDGDDVYTVHKNPIFIATKAICLGLSESWEHIAVDAEKVPQALGVGLLASLNRGEEHAVQAIHALDFGDYAMAVSLFKRAMSTLNGSLALLNAAAASDSASVERWRTAALPRMFDLREIWLRVMAECREELERPSEEEN
jgi:hypothetical protein